MPGIGPTPDVNREKEEKELVLLPELGYLATYIGHIPRASIYLC
jgi:hypothetical protein